MKRMRYRIPEIWNCWGYGGAVEALPVPASGRARQRSGKLRELAFAREIAVDPTDYLRACLAWIDAHAAHRGRIGGESLSQICKVKRAAGRGSTAVREPGGAVRRGGDWIRSASLYGMIVRASTAWDHDGDGKLAARASSHNELGTFLKTILLLPHLRRMGVSVLYMLPVVTVSHLYRKGELGCPYAARDFFALDPAQADDAFGDRYGDVNAQFGLLVDCAHRLDMRVMLDVAPRTAARDSDWILDHPEWFYWIDRRFANDYAAPHVPGVKYLNPRPGRLREIYDVPEVREHLSKFRHAPSVRQPAKWREFVRQVRRKRPDDLVREIARHFEVMTPPGFSDCINDHQPPWTDVTYLRLFEDHHAEARRLLADPDSQPPYVLFDIAKASLFQGQKPMRRLWDKLADIIPFYQRFGVDGARVDMAHALPARLERMILDRPRQRDPDFCFLAEELGTHHHAKAAAAGYNIIIGPSWSRQPRGHQGEMHELVRELPKLAVPVIAAAETPDTPRTTTRHGGLLYARQAVVVDHFLPNAVPMIHSGQEVLERQPANLGLDAHPPDRLALDERDPLYDKLAFFDRAALHWGNPGGEEMTQIIAQAAHWRKKYAGVLLDPRAYFAPKLAGDTRKVLATAYRLPAGGVLIMLSNFDYAAKRAVRLPAISGENPPEILFFVEARPVIARRAQTFNVMLPPGGAALLRIAR